MSARIPRIASLKTVTRLRAHVATLGVELPCDDALETGADAPLARPLELGGGLRAPNRFVIQPMEGWDGTSDGLPTELTERRWRRFGSSGAGWIWGGEAVAVQPEGRANPNQLMLSPRTAPALGRLRRGLLDEASAAGHPAPVTGLQLTHSGRWARPEGAPRPRIAYRHPLLDARVGVAADAAGDAAVLGDGEVRTLIADFASAARLAAAEGFDFVDLKHCHGYLLHEFLSAHVRPGAYGGAALAARTRLALELVDAVRDAAPGLRLGVRLSVFDAVPHRGGAEQPGAPEPHPLPYPFAFGARPEAPDEPDPTESIALVRALLSRGVGWINVTAASPYYAPHLQRPALFPPSDGYPPPEDPLVGVARLLGAARALKAAVPEAVVVSSGWTYLQEFLAPVAQATLRAGWFDAIGLGRLVLSYPDLPADAIAGRRPDRRRVCRTFSDCTTAPRHGLPSGCYPLDDFYRERPENDRLQAIRRGTP